jgi:hypothetical protein
MYSRHVRCSSWAEEAGQGVDLTEAVPVGLAAWRGAGQCEPRIASADPDPRVGLPAAIKQREAMCLVCPMQRASTSIPVLSCGDASLLATREKAEKGKEGAIGRLFPFSVTSSPLGR